MIAFFSLMNGHASGCHVKAAELEEAERLFIALRPLFE
jgi:hypothetical protein